MKKIILKLTGLKLTGSIIGLIYSVLQVRYFGASAEMDAFFVAITAVYTITSLIQGGQLAEVFLPEYLNQKTRYGSRAAHKLLSAVLNRMMVFVGILLTVLYFAAPVFINLIGPGLSADFKELASSLFSISLVLIFLTFISSFVNTTLNAEQIFGRPEVTGLINGFVSILLLIKYHEQFGVYILIYSLLAGKVIEFLIGMIFLKRINYNYQLIWRPNDYDVSNFFKVMFTTSGYVAATQIYSVIMTAMASFLPPGSLSIFNYVKQLSSKASGIIISPISTVFFSKFSAMVSEGRKDLSIHLKQPLAFTLGISLIIFAFIIFSGEELLHMIWSKKSLTSSEYDIAYLFLTLNFFGFIFNSAGAIFRKASVAMGKANILYKRWTVVQLISAAYAFLSIYFFGIFGLATVLVINMILMAYVSYYSSRQSGIDINDLSKELFLNKRFYIFLTTLTISILIMFSLFQLADLANWEKLILKFATLSTVFVLMGLGFFKTPLKASLSQLFKR